VEPGALARERLFERVLVRAVFTLGIPWTRDRDLVEQRESHTTPSPTPRRTSNPAPLRVRDRGCCNCFTIRHVGWTGLRPDDIAALACGPFLAACALLAVAGAGKMRHPSHTGAAARALGLPGNRAALRTLGAAELAIGLAGIGLGGAAAFVVAVSYGALTIAALLLWRGAPETPCGCIGASTAPASGAHVGVNAGAAVAAAVAAFGPRPFTVIADQPLAGVPFLVLVALAAGLAALVADSLPALRATVREEGA
jgi:hypothetical protein